MRQARYDEERAKDADAVDWDAATEDEAVEAAREDEAKAREEQARMKAFVADALVHRRAPRPRPLLVMISRDVPAAAKRRIVAQLSAELQGMFVRVDMTDDRGKAKAKARKAAENAAAAAASAGGKALGKAMGGGDDSDSVSLALTNGNGGGHSALTEAADATGRGGYSYGVDCAAFQNILSAGQSIIADVDVGMSAATRGAFVQALAATKAALVPAPSCVVVLADPRNRHGAAGDARYGARDGSRALPLSLSFDAMMR